LLHTVPSFAQEEDDANQLYEENPPLTTIQPEAVEDSLFGDILALSERRKLNDHPSHQKLEESRWAVTAYLYSRPGDEGYCVPETHDICTSDYILAVHNHELPIRAGAFHLGRFGELTEFRWMESEAFGEGRLRFTAKRYPGWAIDYNPALREKQRSQEYHMWLTPDSIRVELVQ
jgi:hypothetical protein